ncbi:MAG: polysaccharide biosynthesis protein [Bacteroidales bacterium]|nr:polysaccharide biosynthesis protein [Bacteroidales bacterium]
MAGLKSLAKDTVIYGLSSIVGRFLNYLLVPLYTAKMSAVSGGYGIVTNVYSYTALLLIILVYGMETTLFRYCTKEGEDPKRVYSTILTSVGFTSMLFVVIVLTFLSPISGAMGYAEHPEYIGVMAVVVALDAFQAIPFSYLRQQKRALKFASLKLLFIVINIALNLLYFVVLPSLYTVYPDIVGKVYSPEVGVGYVFYLNLICTSIVMLFLLPELRGFKWIFDWSLYKRMLGYSAPILLLGIAGVLNQNADKIMFPFLYEQADCKAQLGIYGAASKIAMIMAMILQAFRYAYEPFVFDKSRDKDSKETYAVTMKYFVIFTLLAFLVVVAYLDIIKYIIAPDYWEGLKVVPIVMVAEIMMGVYFNLSFWYKLTEQTIWGAVFSGIGCVVLLGVNILFVPQYGYMACAWGGVAGYGTAMLLSYFVGQKKYPIAYPVKVMLGYVVLACVLFVAMEAVKELDMLWQVCVNTVLLVAFAIVVVKVEKISFAKVLSKLKR